MNAILSIGTLIAALPLGQALVAGPHAVGSPSPTSRQQRHAGLEAEPGFATLQAAVARATSFGQSGISSHHGLSSLTSAMPWGWIFVGFLVFVIIPTIVLAGFVSLSSQVNAPGLVAGAVAVVLGRVTGRRGPPQPEKQDEGRSRATSFHRSPPAPHMPAQPQVPPQVRPAGREPARHVSFAAAPSFASAPSSTASVFGRPPPGPDARLPSGPQAARAHLATEPPSTPVYCEPAVGLHAKGDRAAGAQAAGKPKPPEWYF
eukprot:CAMPEP_0171180810 /NCGR_PEP_ID=MMETSP0790-20130122/13945_1 /TAXON_ID=2925 /ORGANISM="Alexandrium catenella, Strain OF101" /LENGTH=259 /DNA_ID=CAMNT_0011645747 /DNA_START=58 /DNA_END=834 /DNA_ORIENTATION=+